MNNHIYYNPTKILFGKGMEQYLGEEIANVNAKKVLLHYGGESVKKYGIYDKVTRILGESGIDYVELGGVQPNPRASLIREGIALSRKEQVDFILALGGGSVIDSAKGIAAGVYYDGDLLDFFTGKAAVEKALPIGVVLTIPGAGSESSEASVITFEEINAKLGMGNDILRPRFSILNPEFTFTLPERLSMCGVVDAITHVYERYFTNTTFVDCTDRIGEGIIMTLMKYGPLLKENPNNYDIRAEVMWACKIAHDGTVGVGREEDWGSHAIEHALSAQYDVTHAAGLAVIVPAWMKYVYRHDIPRFLQLARRVFGIETENRDPDEAILEMIEKYKEFLKSLGMPLTLRELGIPDQSKLAQMAEICAKYAGGTVGNFVKLNAQDIEKIYQLAY